MASETAGETSSERSTGDIFDYMDEEDRFIFTYAVHEDVFACGGCGTDVSLSQQLIRVKLQHNVYYAEFESLVNFRYDPWNLIPARKRCPMQDIYCKICGCSLGFDLLGVNARNMKNKGRFLVILNNLMLRKDGAFCDAVTEQPLHKNALHDECKVVKEGNDLFICHRCTTRIAAYEQWIRKYFRNDKCYTLFGNLEGITHDDNILTNTKCSVQSVHCRKCHYYLGMKLIDVPEPDEEVKVERYIVFTHKILLLKQGQLYDAATEEPHYNKSKLANAIRPY